jgi:hypothetical protein
MAVASRINGERFLAPPAGLIGRIITGSLTLRCAWARAERLGVLPGFDISNRFCYNEL